MNPDPANEPAVTYWVIGRFYCPRCQTVKTCVRERDVTIVTCDCGEVCDVASGDE